MKIVSLHGDDIEASYARYSKIIDGVRKKGWRIEELSYKDDIKNKLINTSLFDDDILYAIKNSDKIDKASFAWISENHSKFTSQLLLYSKKKLSATQKKSLPKNTKYEEFSLPVVLWQFLDSLVPGNSSRALKLYLEASKTSVNEILISLMAGLFRDMYIVHSNGKLSYPDWRANKIMSQARKFTKSEVKSIISELAEIDYKSKTSDTDSELLIEMLLIKNLE